MKWRVSKNNQAKECVSKNDQLQCIRIAVDRFFKQTLSLDQFLKLAFVPDRFFIGGIDFKDFSGYNDVIIQGKKFMKIVEYTHDKNFFLY